MTESTGAESGKPTDWKGQGIVGLRFLQIISMAAVAIGFIWGFGDFINSLMPNGTSAPMSLLLILYGLVGSVVIEVPIRILKRQKNSWRQGSASNPIGGFCPWHGDRPSRFFPSFYGWRYHKRVWVRFAFVGLQWRRQFNDVFGDLRGL